MSVYTTTFPVRFGDCDPAGIVYYPRYFDMIHKAFECWIEEGWGTPLHLLIGKRKLGAPAVHFTIDFLRPTRFGDVLTAAIKVQKISTRSATLDILFSCQGEERLRAKKVIVFTDFSGVKPKGIPIPEDIRARLEIYSVL